jgi:glycosyltransferase 2 family protein
MGRRDVTENTVSSPAGSDALPDRRAFDSAPPGERYFRHPGDVVRLVLWGSAALLLAVVIAIGTHTTDGLTSDLGRVAGRAPESVRELLLALTQVLALAVPAAVAIGLVVAQRWRRLGIILLAAVAGSALWVVLDVAIDLPGRLPDALTRGMWVASPRFPSLAYLSGAAAAAIVGKPWLSRQWRRATDIALLVLALVMAAAGSAGVPAILLAASAGAAVGAALLVVFGAPNRRPAPATVAAALTEAGLDVSGLQLQRAVGGRSQLYVANLSDGRHTFVKVFGRDSRDADLLYRGYRTLLLRGPNDSWPSPSLKLDVEHEALLLLLAHQDGVACPRVETVASLADGSVALALEYVDGRRLDELAPDEVDDHLLDATWSEVGKLHGKRMAHRALRAANVLVGPDGPIIIDLGFGEESATARMQAIDRAELLASLAVLVGADRAVASAARVVGPAPLARAIPYLQPLALSAATRKQVSKSMLQDLRAAVATVSGEVPPPLERLIRVRPRTVFMIAALVGAFYVLLPQLANVGDSFRAIRHAGWAWLVVCLLMSFLTYVASAIGMSGTVPEHIPFVANVEAQMASSFVNRVSPANVGGMALNVRFLQKAGVPTAEAVTGVGLNSIAGAIVHVVLLIVFFAWAGQGGGTGFSIPGGSKVLVVIAVVLALLGILVATRRGRRLLRTTVLDFVKQALTSTVSLARSPAKLAALFGGSVALTLAYIGALGAAVAAMHGHLSIAEIGAVYLGASIIAAAAPTPGGLGALEAAVVAGLTGVGVESGAAVAAVLSYRLVTYWLPILPGWISFHALERRGLI